MANMSEDESSILSYDDDDDDDDDDEDNDGEEEEERDHQSRMQSSKRLDDEYQREIELLDITSSSTSLKRKKTVLFEDLNGEQEEQRRVSMMDNEGSSDATTPFFSPVANRRKKNSSFSSSVPSSSPSTERRRNRSSNALPPRKSLPLTEVKHRVDVAQERIKEEMKKQQQSSDHEFEVGKEIDVDALQRAFNNEDEERADRGAEGEITAGDTSSANTITASSEAKGERRFFDIKLSGTKLTLIDDALSGAQHNPLFTIWMMDMEVRCVKARTFMM